MKVTPALKKELAQWLDTYWTTYLKGDIETWATFLRDDYRNIGGTKEEIWNSKQEIIDYTYRILDQMIGTAEIRNREIEVIPYGEYMMVNEFTDLYVKIEGEWTFYGPFRMSSLLEKTDTGWIALHQHGSYPDMKAMEGEAYSIDAMKAENARLLASVKSRTIELEIEAALERVRAVAMGMKEPEDMLDVCRIISDQLQQFGVDKIRNVQLAIIDENIGQYLCYQYFTPYEKTAVEKTEYLKSPVEHGMVNQMLASRDGYFIGGLSGKELEEFRSHRKEENHFPDPFLDKATELDYCFLSIGEGGLGLTLYQPITEDVLTLFKRFHQVFSLAYQRFRDIQKAEAQAREAQIEAALERVRAQTMAMHSSEDVGKCIVKMFAELTALGVDEGTRFGIGILNHDNENNQLWTARKEGEEVKMHIGNLDMSWHPLLISARKAWMAQIPFHKYVLEGEDLLDYYRMLNTAPDYKIQIPIEKLPKKEIQHCFIFEHGFFYAFSPHEFQPDLIQITKRFSSLFEQTYRRYLDLVKAEAQTREAQIEAALEKVRSLSLAMHHSDELEKVVMGVSERLSELGFQCDGSLIFIFDSEKRNITLWIATSHLPAPLKIHLPFDPVMVNNPVWKTLWHAMETGEHVVNKIFSGKEKDDYFRYVQKYNPETLQIPVKGSELELPDWTVTLAAEKNAILSVDTWSDKVITHDEFQILIRFAKVFQQAYTRFLDLQKAEAQAKEATKQASLDRVRGVISSMRSAADLELITPLIFKELTILGVPFIRCGVFIIHEKQEIVEAYLSSPDGNSLGVLRLPFQASELTYQTVEAWRKGVVYRKHWNKEDFMQWIEQLMKQDQIQDSSTYQGSAAPPESLDLHFVPFAQGMLYVGSIGPLGEEEIELVKSLTKAFSIAYARYEDFVKLDNAKAEVESAMTELKATQSQLVQQEKLASLGQLTAGIAHEIKNPLNFVNNFSEVSIEMIEEIRDSRLKTQDTRPKTEDDEIEDEILEDIKANLKKIHEHGSRANGIVTSMLQHSRGGTGKKEPTDLNALIKEYSNLAFHGMRAGKNPINVAIDLQLDEQIRNVPLVSEDFSRVLLNLCNNAFDAMRITAEIQPPKLSIRTKLQSEKILIEVEDNGAGIPDEIKDKILQPFFTTKKGTEGTGLGLSITHDIIKAHGGQLDIQSQPGSTIFKIYLTL